ncbi:c-type cytochrome [Negadavirga shengliensis]|uniref:C-type cytochrome n=1 Tax=Negadavirga shengliensis TaxID=1389218 RepID=A0ABV9T6V3_9BACT
MTEEKAFFRLISRLVGLIGALALCQLGVVVLFITGWDMARLTGGVGKNFRHFPAAAIAPARESPKSAALLWKSPDISSIPDTEEGDLVRYGRELIAHTSIYLGPKGKVGNMSNGMNCQNCHLEAGTVPYGNNYGKVAAIYPKLRHRSGTVEGFEKRINDCIERSLNGQKLDAESREMAAMVSYLKWVGKEVENEESFEGFGLIPLPYLDRPADPLKGKIGYGKHCASCHGENGGGELAASGLEWIYPPLYGEESYNTGAGLYRISSFASYVKYNMPYGTTYEAPILTDEEAWDVAAFVNSMPRPEKDFSEDWPDISKKPVDHPFGPYVDGFSEEQHKYGPFGPIIAAYQ